MKVIIHKTNASLKRRKELQAKILFLLCEYQDVPIFVAFKTNFSESNDKTMFDFSKGEQRNQVHIVNLCSFFGKKIIKSKSK